MGKPHKHADLIKAWADGAEIQGKSLFSRDKWLDFNGAQPLWLEHYEYRIKPEPKPYSVQYMNVYKTGRGFGCATSNVKTLYQCEKASGEFLRGRIRLIIDGETGKLKSAEVINE